MEGELRRKLLLDNFSSLSLNDPVIRNVVMSVNDSPGISGTITRAQILEVMPFRNEIIHVVLPGETLYEILETSVAEYDMSGEDPPGGFLQMSGSN